MFVAEKVKNDIVSWIRNWFQENGNGCNAVIGISGGKDSTVAAALCVEALGPDRVIGVLMPNGFQKDFQDAKEVCSHLSIKNYTINIMEAVLAIRDGLGEAGIETSTQARINLPPRLRMTTLYAVAQSLNGRVSCNGNLSEIYLGYYTYGGDNIGAFAPLADLTTDEVMMVGDALGLPPHLVHKTPSDGLCGKTDEDNLGIPYSVVNKYIRTGVCEDQEMKRKIDELHTRNLFKTNPVAKFVYNN